MLGLTVGGNRIKWLLPILCTHHNLLDTVEKLQKISSVAEVSVGQFYL